MRDKRTPKDVCGEAINYPDIVTFHLVSGDLRGGKDKGWTIRKLIGGDGRSTKKIFAQGKIK